MPDALKPGRHRVDEEAAYELIRREGHSARLPLVPVAIIFPLESHLAVVDLQQPLVGNGNTMRIPAQVFKNLLRSAEWRFRIYDPFAALLGRDECVKGNG